MKPTEAQGELLGTLGPKEGEGPTLRGARRTAAFACEVIGDLKRKFAARGNPDAEPSPFLPPEAQARPFSCQLAVDPSTERPMRGKDGKYLDPHDWRPSDRPGWLRCARCCQWTEVPRDAR